MWLSVTQSGRPRTNSSAASRTRSMISRENKKNTPQLSSPFIAQATPAAALLTLCGKAKNPRSNQPRRSTGRAARQHGRAPRPSQQCQSVQHTREHAHHHLKQGVIEIEWGGRIAVNQKYYSPMIVAIVWRGCLLPPVAPLPSRPRSNPRADGTAGPTEVETHGPREESGDFFLC